MARQQGKSEEIWDEHYMVLFSFGIHSGIPEDLLDSVPSSVSFLCKSLQTPSSGPLPKRMGIFIPYFGDMESHSVQFAPLAPTSVAADGRLWDKA